MNYHYLTLGMLMVIMIQFAYIVFLLTRIEKSVKNAQAEAIERPSEDDENQAETEWVQKPAIEDHEERMTKLHNIWPHNR